MGYVERLQDEAQRWREKRRFGLPATEGRDNTSENEQEDARRDREVLEEYRQLLKEARAPRTQKAGHG